jgi:hypothetical protein
MLYIQSSANSLASSEGNGERGLVHLCRLLTSRDLKRRFVRLCRTLAWDRAERGLCYDQGARDWLAERSVQLFGKWGFGELMRKSYCLAKTRKEEIARFDKARSDVEFGNMLKMRMLSPEQTELQTQLRRGIQVSGKLTRPHA